MCEAQHIFFDLTFPHLGDEYKLIFGVIHMKCLEEVTCEIFK